MFRSLAESGTQLLRGQLTLICAAPGGLKSALALTWAARSRVSTLYLSADSDAFTQLTRMLSIELGWKMEESKHRVRTSELGADAERALAESKIRFSYRSSPTLRDIRTSVEAYEEVYGDFPSLVIVDNITNVRTELNSEDPFAGLEVVAEELDELAGITGSAVLALHHVQGPYNDGDKPIPLSGIKNQIGRVPEMVITLHRPRDQFGSDQLRVSTVKSRTSAMDPTGQSWVPLAFDGDLMSIKDST